MNTDLQAAYAINQNELNRLKEKYKTLHQSTTSQLLEAERRRKQAEENTEIALLRVQEIFEELQNCKDELFNLQPPNQVADTHISAEWEALCSSITSWIDDQSGGIDDLRSQLMELKAKKQLSETVDKYWGEDRQLIANHYSNPLEDLLRYNIHCLLEDRVFNHRVYMVGLHPKEAELLHTIEHSMARLEPQRDPSSIGLWRSEALAALSSRAEYGRHLEDDAQKITQEARDFLGSFLRRQVPGAMSAFHHDITMPAIKLASTMRQSTANYHFVFRVASNKDEEARPRLPLPEKGLLLYRADLEDIDVVDIGSGIRLKKARDYAEAKDGSIAQIILVMQPALYRNGATERILLSKQVVLADLFKPPQRRGQTRDVEGSRELLEKYGFKFNS